MTMGVACDHENECDCGNIPVIMGMHVIVRVF
jgi:hypothetical protein